MGIYNEKISDNSVWVTATPTPVTLSLPFYATEAGYFKTENGYMTEREEHDSFLLLYTISGKGYIKTKYFESELLPYHAIVIDCHTYHSYYCNDDEWDFLWIHIKGDSISSVFKILYPESISSIRIRGHKEFEDFATNLIDTIAVNDVAHNISSSADIHSLLNTLIKSRLQTEANSRKTEQSDEVSIVVSYIKQNFSNPISIDDMISNIHISKYHFIRIFKRITGVTPYSYLTNYRLNISKTMLISTNKTVAEIAEKCGFLDTSNFITQFKKHTGQRPLEYRKDFS